MPSNGHHQHEEAQRLKREKQKQSRIKIFFFFSPRRKSADFAAELLRGFKLTGRLSCFSSLLHPTFYLCILWTFGWMNTADVATSRCSTAPCLRSCRRAGRRRFLLTWRRINFPTVADQTFQSIKSAPVDSNACKSNFNHPPYERRL